MFLCQSKLLKIYTRTGDKGTSSLFTGKRVSKSDPIFEVLGSVDILSSAIGLSTASLIKNTPTIQQLISIQSRLQDLNSHIATPRSDKITKGVLARTLFSYSHVEQLEKWIDGMDTELTPLTKFILPGGSLASAHLHISRGFCRSAERRCVELFEIDSNYDVSVLKYLNRLSDYLFTAARFANKLENIPDPEYVNK